MDENVSICYCQLLLNTHTHTYHGTYKRSFTCMCSHVIVHFMSLHEWLFVSSTIFPFTKVSGLFNIMLGKLLCLCAFLYIPCHYQYGSRKCAS